MCKNWQHLAQLKKTTVAVMNVSRIYKLMLTYWQTHVVGSIKKGISNSKNTNMGTIKFRGKRVDNGGWVYGYYWQDNSNGKHKITVDLSDDNFICHEVDPETVGQFSTFLTKDGKEIYAGDNIYCLVPYRTTQTHTGDNIPNGSYTEPMEPGIKAIGGTVVFIDGCFQVEDDRGTSPMFHLQTEWDLESIKEAIEWTRQDAGWFDDPEEGDLQYLISEVAKVKDANELIEHLNGWIIEGNIHDEGTP